jgi:phytoene desaturase (3,4-didehydrolycopene-forming)
MSAEQRTAIVIGAGVGGVALATRLAKAGFKVDVFEKNDFTGGRCSLINHEGYVRFFRVFVVPYLMNRTQRFDQGPSLLLLPDLFQETFADLGTSLVDAGVNLVKCEPNYRVHFHDGESILLSTDLSVMKKEIERLEGKRGFEGFASDRFWSFSRTHFYHPRYLAWLQEAHRHYELSVEHVLKKNFTSLLSLLRPSFLPYIMALHPLVSIVRLTNHISVLTLNPKISGVALRSTSRLSAFVGCLHLA